MLRNRSSCRLASVRIPGICEYPFVELGVGNQPQHNICLGIAGTIACLEEATEVEGEVTIEKMSDRIWMQLHDPQDDFTYPQYARLPDGNRVLSCSQAAVEKLAVLIQGRYEHTVGDDLWQTGVEPDPTSAAGRALLATRRKYMTHYHDRVTSRSQLKKIIGNDRDKLVAMAGRGVRQFEHRPPDSVIEKYNLTMNPGTNRYPDVPSNHAFLITYDKQKDSFYVYDSDDPDRKWLALTHGIGDRFVLDWHIQDHMGNGPSRQVYHDIKPVSDLLTFYQRILRERSAAR